MLSILIPTAREFTAKPLRTLASVAGMIAAIAAVICVDAAGLLSTAAADQYLRARFGQPATVEITASRPGEAGVSGSDELTRALRANGFVRSSRNSVIGGVFVHGDRSEIARTALVDPEYRHIRSPAITAGGFPRDLSGFQVHAVVAQAVIENLGFPSAESAIGERVGFAVQGTEASVDLKQVPFTDVTIDAVMRDGTDSDSPQVLLVGASGEGSPDVAVLARIAPSDLTLLEQLAKLVGGEIPGVSGSVQVRRVDDNSALRPILEQQERTFSFVSVIALASGSLGLVGVGLSSARERARDLGVRRALGATRGALFCSVVLESVLGVLLAAALAIPLSAAFIRMFPRQLILPGIPLPDDLSLPLSSIASGVLAAAAAGILAGVVTAIYSARRSVVDVLRS